MRILISMRGPARAWLVVVLSCLWGCGKTPNIAEEKIFTVAASNASNPTIALEKKTETVFVAWIGRSGEAENVFLAKLGKGEGQFSSPVQVNDTAGDASAHSEAPAQIAAGPEGNVYVLWHNEIQIEGRRFPASNLRFARSTDGGKSFAPVIYVNDDHDGPPTGHNFHSLAVAPDGTVYVCWLDGRNKAAAPEVRVARSKDGGQSFEPSVVVTSKICPCCRTALTVDAEGILYVVYRDAPPDNVRNMAVARSEDGGKTFSAPTLIHDDGWVIDGCPHNGATIDTDAVGNLHVAWYTGKEEGYGVYYAVSSDRGEHFEAPLYLNAGMEASPIRAAVAAWNGKAAVLACEANDGYGPKIFLLGPGRTPTGQLQQQSLAAGVYPAIAKHADMIALAWLDGDAIRAAVKRFDQTMISSF